MTLSDHKGKQIMGDAIQNCFLQDFQTMFMKVWDLPHPSGAENAEFVCLALFLIK
jgi:hypothetical protein